MWDYLPIRVWELPESPIYSAGLMSRLSHIVYINMVMSLPHRMFSLDNFLFHIYRINTPRKQGGLGEMKIPLIADKSMKIGRDYGVLNEEAGVTFR